MANSRDDVFDATGRRTFIAGEAPVSGLGGGNMRGWPMNASDANLTTGVPTNGTKGWLPGAIFQNFRGSVGSILYVNVGTVASSTWVELTGGGGFSFITMPANTVDAFYFTDGTTKVLDLDTRNTVTGVTAVKVTASPPTITSATGDTFSQFGTAAITVTLTGTTTVTALDGIGAYLGAPTVTDASAVTVTTVSNLYVALPVAAGSATLTNIYGIHSAGGVLVDAGGVTVTAGGVTISASGINLAAAAQSITVKANTAATMTVTDGTTAMLTVDSRNTLTGANTLTVLSSPNTIASAAAVHRSSTLVTAAKTITYTGTNTVTSNLGAGAFFDTVTFTDASAGTITTVSNLHVAQVAAAGGSLTITNTRMISTGVSDCFLTNAGVWTDTASSRAGKTDVMEADYDAIDEVIDQIQPRSWHYREGFHGNDYGRQRLGIVADELPEALITPGEAQGTGVAAGVLASFSMAAIKKLRDENRNLKSRLERLEALLN